MQTETVLIQEIRTKALYGKYDHKIRTSHSDNITLLYGVNGVGKTTVLNLLFHLMSPHLRRGHRTAIGQIPFDSFEVELNNGTTISASRSDNNLGNYSFAISSSDALVEQMQITFDEDDDIVDRDGNLGDELQEFISKIYESYPNDIFYIADDRSISSDRFEPTKSGRPQLQLAWPRIGGGTSHSYRNPDIDPNITDFASDLHRVLDQATTWIHNRSFGASLESSATANSIYIELARQLTRPEVESMDGKEAAERLRTQLAQVEARTAECAEYGLIQRFEATEFLQILGHAQEAAYPAIVAILKPHLESIEAQLDALRSLQLTIESFVARINSMLQGKRIAVSLPSGIQIYTDDGEYLAVDDLSSGEHQLLLLLASTLCAQNKAPLFIIDEPELSMNITWQRQLVDALSECTGRVGAQYIIATHSFEVLAEHMEKVEEVKPH